MVPIAFGNFRIPCIRTYAIICIRAFLILLCKEILNQEIPCAKSNCVSWIIMRLDVVSDIHVGIYFKMKTRDIPILRFARKCNDKLPQMI